jgi:hypothetical protein
MLDQANVIYLIEINLLGNLVDFNRAGIIILVFIYLINGFNLN